MPTTRKSIHLQTSEGSIYFVRGFINRSTNVRKIRKETKSQISHTSFQWKIGAKNLAKKLVLILTVPFTKRS